MQVENCNINRLSNYELFRIIVMFFIVLGHLGVHGIINYVEMPNHSLITIFNYYCSLMFSMLSRVGVNIFVLISGYFLIAKPFKFEKFSTIYLTTLFYTIFFLTIFLFFDISNIDKRSFLQSIFPFGGEHYWFITTYLFLYLISPYLNIFFKTIKKYDYNILLIILIVFWCILPSCMRGANYAFSNLGWFITLYGIAAYIKLYGINIKQWKLYLSILISIIFASLFTILNLLHPVLELQKYKFGNNNILTFIISLALFLIVRNLHINNNKFINSISQSIFGIYLIHENILFRPYLWHGILHIEKYQNSYLYLFYSLFFALMVFCSCLLIDRVLSFVYKPIIRILNKFIIYLYNKNQLIYIKGKIRY